MPFEMSQSESKTSTKRRPELLAPVGGWQQFYAALNAGADAVFLGLKQFNARARAENFTLDDLKVLVPIAHHYGVKVLITLNVLIKDQELPELIAYLSALQTTGIDAVIVQDFAVARLIKKFFPKLRLHASTQMAVHNTAGVRALIEHGFRRVVVAREMTAIELKRMRHELKDTGIEIEAFCHGSLCYSYSGLCFFSGANDARSGNRGECAYTCREPYKILNEPGQGFLFSMRDLDTRDLLHHFIDAEVDTLKIEGRKKDAQYVAAVVGTYRKRLDQILGPRTDRLYPELPGDTLPVNAEQALAMTFQRKSTSFFTAGRYVENVIDLDNPSHKGVLAGTVTQIRDDKVKIRLEVALDRFDGVRLAPDSQVYRAKPQHDKRAGEDTTVALKQRYDNEELSFSVRSMWRDAGQGQALVPTAKEADIIWLQLPEDHRLRPAIGWKLWRVRSNEIKQWAEQMAKLPPGIKPKPWRMVDLELSLAAQELTVALVYGNEKVAARRFALEGLQSSDNDTLTAVLRDSFQVFGDAGIKTENLSLNGTEHKFLPMSQVKQLKRAVVAWLSTELLQQDQAALQAASAHLTEGYAALNATGDCQFAIKTDDIVTAERALAEAFARGLQVTELVFEPKRSRLEQAKPDTFLNELERLAKTYQVSIRLAFPLVTRAWDEPLLKRWFQAYAVRFAPRYEVGNIGCFDLLRSWGLVANLAAADISSDFSLYALNRESVAFLADKGVTTATLSIEDDETDMASLCQHWPKNTNVAPQVVLYKDTPLFIAEACSLTALHNGCPSSKVCGYRTLHIENKAGERFYVAHENCKSIVYGEQAFALSHQRQTFERMGIRRFRLDFLTRPFTTEQVQTIIAAVATEKRVPETHTANFERRLL